MSSQLAFLTLDRVDLARALHTAGPLGMCSQTWSNSSAVMYDTLTVFPAKRRP